MLMSWLQYCKFLLELSTNDDVFLICIFMHTYLFKLKKKIKFFILVQAQVMHLFRQKYSSGKSLSLCVFHS